MQETQKCLEIVNELINREIFSLFVDPIDPVEDNIPEYPKIVKNPQDLTTIKGRLERGEYTRFEDFNRDMTLVFTNSILYNGRETFIGEISLHALAVYQKKVRDMVKPTAYEWNTRVSELIHKINSIMKNGPPVFARVLNSAPKSLYPNLTLTRDDLSAVLSRLTSKSDTFVLSQILNQFDCKMDGTKDTAFVSLAQLPQKAIDALIKYGVERNVIATN